MRGVIGKKLGMTQLFDQDGNQVAVTVIELQPNHVLQVKTVSGKDGYNAVKLATGTVKAKALTRPEIGVFKAASIEPKRTIMEFRLTDAEVAQFKQGDAIDGSFLIEGALVHVKGISKGKGFAGVIKRHGFKGAKEATHGTHEYRRHGGAIGQGSWPGHVFKNKRMPGHMGDEATTIRNLKIVGLYLDQNLVLLSGAVPGGVNGIVRIFETKPKIRKKTFAPVAKKK
jgi:large subunit ribosomal protein L3